MEELMNVDNLTEEEKNKILLVIKRDEDLRRAQDTRIGQLKTEIHNLRMQSILRDGDDLSKICARCHKPFGFFFNTGDICTQCKFRVCSVCRESLLSGKWLCVLCYKQVQLKGLTGEWIYGGTDNESHQKSWSGAEMVKKSLRKSLSANGNLSAKTREGDGGSGGPESKHGLIKNSSASHEELDRVGYPKDSDKKRLSSLFDSFKSNKDEAGKEKPGKVEENYHQVKRVSCRRRRDSDSESDSGSSMERESPMEVVDSKTQLSDNVSSAHSLVLAQNLSETESTLDLPKAQRLSTEISEDVQVPNNVQDSKLVDANGGQPALSESPRRSQSPEVVPMTPTETVITVKRRSGEPEHMPVLPEAGESPMSPVRNASQMSDHRPNIVRRTSSEKSDSSMSSARTASPATKMRLLDLASKRALERESFDQEESGNESPKPKENSLTNGFNRTRGHRANGSSARQGCGEGGSVLNAVESSAAQGEGRQPTLAGICHSPSSKPAYCQITTDPILHSLTHEGARDAHRRVLTPIHDSYYTEHDHPGFGVDNMPALSHTDKYISDSENDLLVGTQSGYNPQANESGYGNPLCIHSMHSEHTTGVDLLDSMVVENPVIASSSRGADFPAVRPTSAAAAAVCATHQAVDGSCSQGSNIPIVTDFQFSPVGKGTNSDISVSFSTPEPSHTQIAFNVIPLVKTSSKCSGDESNLILGEGKAKEVQRSEELEEDKEERSAEERSADTSETPIEHSASEVILSPLFVPTEKDVNVKDQRPLSQSSGTESLSPGYEPVEVDIGVSELILNDVNPRLAMMMNTEFLLVGSESSLEDETNSEELPEEGDKRELLTDEDFVSIHDQSPLVELSAKDERKQVQEELVDVHHPSSDIKESSITVLSSEQDLEQAESQQTSPLIDLTGVSTIRLNIIPTAETGPSHGQDFDLMTDLSETKAGELMFETTFAKDTNKPSIFSSEHGLSDNFQSSDVSREPRAVSEPHSSSSSSQTYLGIEFQKQAPDNDLVVSEQLGNEIETGLSTSSTCTYSSTALISSSPKQHATMSDNITDSDASISDLTNSSKYSGSDPSISPLSSDTESSVLTVDSNPHIACSSSYNITRESEETQILEVERNRNNMHVRSGHPIISKKPSGVVSKGNISTGMVVLESSDHIPQDTASASANSPHQDTCSESEADDIEVSEFPLYASPDDEDLRDVLEDKVQEIRDLPVHSTQSAVRGQNEDDRVTDDSEIRPKGRVRKKGPHESAFEYDDILETKSEPSTVYHDLMDDTVPERSSTPKSKGDIIDDETLFNLVSMPATQERPRRRGSKDDSEIMTKTSPPSSASTSSTAASSAATMVNLSTIGLILHNDEGDPFATDPVHVKEAMHRYMEQEEELSDCLSVITERTEPEDDSDDVSEISKGLDETVEDEELNKEIEKIYQANLNIDSYLTSEKLCSGSASAAIKRARKGLQKKHIEEVLSSPAPHDLPVISESEPESKETQNNETSDKISTVSDTISAYLSDMSSVDNSNLQTPASSKPGTDDDTDDKSAGAASDEQDSAWFDMSMSVDSVKEILTPRKSVAKGNDVMISASTETLCEEELPHDDEPGRKNENTDVKTSNSNDEGSVMQKDHLLREELSEDHQSNESNRNKLEHLLDSGNAKTHCSLPVHVADDFSSASDTLLSSSQITSLPDLDLQAQVVTSTSAASPASPSSGSSPDIRPQVTVTGDLMSDETESHGGDSGHISGTSADNTPEHRSRSPRHSHLSIPSLALTSTSAEEQASQEEEEEDIDKVVATHKSIGSLRGSYGNLNSSLALGSKLSSDSRESLYSVYSDAGEINYGRIPVTGEILFGVDYNYKTGALEIYIKQCKDIAPVDTKRNKSDPYVKTYLLPDRTRSGKRKTKIKKHTLNPTFDEVLRYVISKSEVENRALWVTVWHHDRFGRNDFLGEVMIGLDCYKFGDATPKWYPLQERLEAPGSAPVSYKGDLIVSVKYVPAENIESKDISKKGKSKKTKGSPTKGELQVLVKEARNLTAVRSNGASDPFCKAYLLPEKHKSSKQKTPVIKRNCNPTWNHVFLFEDVDLTELKDRSLELTLWDYDKITSNDFLGGVRLNLGTGVAGGRAAEWMDARGEEIAIWQSMMDRPNCWNDATIGLRASMGKSEIRK